jgi:hypothetical protein
MDQGKQNVGVGDKVSGVVGMMGKSPLPLISSDGTSGRV